jgi:hypothetical protein
MKGDVRRSEESLISFFAGLAFNKCRIVKAKCLGELSYIVDAEFFLCIQAMRCPLIAFLFFCGETYNDS